MNKIVKGAIAAVAVVALATGCTGACGGSSASEDSGIEFEDCDAEDRRNREAECGLTKMKTQKPVVKQTKKTTMNNRTTTRKR